MLIEGSGLTYYKFLPKLPLPGPLFVTWLGPKPLGITPPHYFGLPERYFLGLTPAEVEDLLSGQAVADAAELRQQVAPAQKAATALGVLRDQIGTASDADLAAAEQLYARLQELQKSNPYVGAQVALPFGVLTAIDTERFARIRAGVYTLPHPWPEIDPRTALRAVSPGTLAVLLLMAIQASNPPDP